jgi:hypothetical protein
VRRSRSITGVSVLGDEQDGDRERTFLLPIRKLFSGEGCIEGCELTLGFQEFHRREKLRRVFTESDIEKPSGLGGPPYLRDSTQPEKIVVLENAGASLIVSSKPEPLVRLARLPSGEIASFKVPPVRELPIVDFALNRNNGSPTTFMIITGGLALAGLEAFLQTFASVDLRPRNAPEFVNIRHKLTDDRAHPIQDLSRELGDDFDYVVATGGYRAALFEDSICDGCIVAKVDGLPGTRSSVAAFSVIAAPKFFPYADEIDIEDWVEEFPSHNRQDQFQKGGPTPLHLGRFPPNLTLVMPGTSVMAFSPEDETAVAIIGQPYAAQTGPTQTRLPMRDLRPEHRTTTFLTDGCSGVFAPGWDVTFAETSGRRFLRDVWSGLSVPRGRQTLRRRERVLAGRFARCGAHVQAQSDSYSDVRLRARLPSRQSSTPCG